MDNFNQNVNQAEITSIRTTVERVDKYLSEFSRTQDQICDGIDGLNKVIKGNGIPGLTHEVESLKKFVNENAELHKNIEEKLNKLRSYEKILKWVLYVGIPTILFHIGTFLLDALKWAITQGYTP